MGTLARCLSRRSPELQNYLRDIDEAALLTRAEECDLAARIALGDPGAGDRLMSQPQDSEEGDDATISQLIDEGRRPPEDDLIEADDLARVLGALGCLDEREAKILRVRFGLDCDSPMTLLEIGEDPGSTRERIRQPMRFMFKRLVL